MLSEDVYTNRIADGVGGRIGLVCPLASDTSESLLYSRISMDLRDNVIKAGLNEDTDSSPGRRESGLKKMIKVAYRLLEP